MSPRDGRTDDEIEALLTEALESRIQRVRHPHRKVDTAMLALIFAVLIQLATAIWFASDMKGSLRTLDRVAAKQELTMDQFARQITDLERRVSTNEAIVNERTRGRDINRRGNQ